MVSGSKKKKNMLSAPHPTFTFSYNSHLPTPLDGIMKSLNILIMETFVQKSLYLELFVQVIKSYTMELI